MKQLVIVNKDCGKKNRYFNIEDWTEEQIKSKIAEYPIKMWFAVRREID